MLFHHFGFQETLYYTVIFGVSRGLGPLAQLIWDRALGVPIERPRSITLADMGTHLIQGTIFRHVRSSKYESPLAPDVMV